MLNPHPTRIPVQAGDVLGYLSVGTGKTDSGAPPGFGMRQATGDVPPNTTATFSAPGGIQIDIAARLEPDADADGFGDESQDNCVGLANPGQENSDGDGQGNACDGDDDNDGVPDTTDAFPLDANETSDVDGDGIGDNGDVDDDNDGSLDVADNCPTTANPGQGDFDQDRLGDACDPLAPGACANGHVGTELRETIVGTAAGDSIRALGGKDIVRGLAGKDCIDGGSESDQLFGGDGADKLEGRDGADKLDGGSSDDKLVGGADGDTLTGGAGKNSYSGGPGNDTIKAANGNREPVNCGSGRDKATVDRDDKVRGCERVKRKK